MEERVFQVFLDSYEIENNLRFLKFSKQLVFLCLVGEKAKENEWEKTHEQEKNLPSCWWSCWWEPLVGAATGEERKWSRRWWSRREENTFWIVDFGKKLGLQSKKTSLTKMAC